MTEEQRKTLEEIAAELPYPGYEDRFMAGAQAAWEMAMKAERERCAHSADLMQHDVRTGETWDEALRRHKHRILNPPKPGGEE